MIGLFGGIPLEIGIINWYGGKTREGRINKFGFLSDLSGKEYYISEKSLQNSLKQPELSKGLLILFSKNPKDDSKVHKVIHLDEASKEQLLEAFSKALSFLPAKHIAARLITFEMRAEVVQLVTAYMLEHGVEALAFPLTSFTSEEILAYFLQTERLSIRDIEYIASDFDIFSQELNEKLIYSLSLINEGMIDHYSIQSLQHYPVLQKIVNIGPSDWKELFEYEQWQQHIITEVIKTIQRHNLYCGNWNDLTPTQWMSNEQTNELLKQNPYQFKRMTILKINEESKKHGLTNTHIEQLIECFSTINSETDKFAPEFFSISLSEILEEKALEHLTRELDEQILINDEIYSYISKPILLQRIEKIQCSDNKLSLYQKVFNDLSEKDKKRFIHHISEDYYKIDTFFPYLTGEKQVQLLFHQFTVSPIITWNLFNNDAKTLIVFRITQSIIENPTTKAYFKESFEVIGKNESNQQLKGILLILHALLSDVHHEQKKNMYFKRMRKYIEEDIIHQLNNHNAIQIIPILPKCNLQIARAGAVQYCEGRFYSPIENGAYCPRIRRACYFQKKSNNRHHGAHLFGNIDRNYDNWTLHELLLAANISSNMPELNQGDTYVNKLAGWINRIEEILERLKCSYCKEAFKVNWSYSRLTASYNVTVYNCLHANGKNGHDFGIYINHCRCCGLTIDSRESRFKVQPNGLFYVCIHCGGAEERPDYQPGNMCPACGKQEKLKKISQNSNWYECNYCNHTIKTSN